MVEFVESTFSYKINLLINFSFTLIYKWLGMLGCWFKNMRKSTGHIWVPQTFNKAERDDMLKNIRDKSPSIHPFMW